MCGTTPKATASPCCRSTSRDIPALVARRAPAYLSIPTTRVPAAGRAKSSNAAFTCRPIEAEIAMDLLFGFLIAASIAVTGVGAGSITAPLLILFLHVPVPEAVGTALVYSAAVKLVVVPIQ